jgi:hypothetical protein
MVFSFQRKLTEMRPDRINDTENNQQITEVLVATICVRKPFMVTLSIHRQRTAGLMKK